VALTPGASGALSTNVYTYTTRLVRSLVLTVKATQHFPSAANPERAETATRAKATTAASRKTKGTAYRTVHLLTMNYNYENTADRSFLSEGWPILELVLPRASDEVVAKVARDVRNGLLDLRLDYHNGVGGYIYTAETYANKSFECNVEIPNDLQRADITARPWRAMNMEARGWIGCDGGTYEPHKMNPNKFLFHLMMTSMVNENLYEKFLTPDTNRPYQIYDRLQKAVITNWGDDGTFDFSEGEPGLEEVKRVLGKYKYDMTAKTDTFVLFERKAR